MAKHVIIESYTFTPSTKTIVVTGKYIRREQLLLITNTTTGTVIYNFSDPALGATSYSSPNTSIDPVTGQETTTIILNYNTSAMSATDKISILTEESYTEIIPSEVMRDPVDKLRVSTPQALIDTDFEYGMQPTKWEQLTLLNGRPSAFYDVGSALSNSASTPTFTNASGSYTISNIAATGKLVTVTINNTAGITAGVPIYVQGTLDNANADGWWIVENVSNNASFSYTVTNTPATALFDATKSFVFISSFYSGAAIPAGTSAITAVGTTVTVTTTGAHGLRVGDGIYVVGATATTNPPNGSWIVSTTPTNNTFTFTVINAPTGTISVVSNTSIYVRALGYVQHRPFDGGVQFSNISPYHGYQVIRQTRRQFRYQSGKGMQFSTGSILKPALQIDTITSSSSTATVTTKYAHGLLPGAVVKVTGCTETNYNITATVLASPAPTPTTFAYTIAPTTSPATGNPVVSPFTWYGSSNRVGMFDHQNGFYFEFDGQTLYAVRRSSTTQISGSVALTSASQSVVGTNTKFSSQLKPGDWIVLRGQSYLVQHITSDTQMYIYPEYKGTTATNCVVSKTINTRYPQSTWNIDKCDGTGASSFNIDLTKMQMFYADYTWYGAGAIRFGFKNNRGEVIYCHRIPNNNVGTEAYMRSGNLVARYETNTLPYYTNLTAAWGIGTGTGTISVADTTGWPPSGTVVVSASAATGAAIEYMTYSSKTTTSLVISARGQPGGATATSFTYSATAPVMVELYSPQQASTISHWGSSVVMDGRYDDDKSFLFNFGQSTPIVYANAGQRYPVFSIRLAPSVDNGLTGLLGARELINRMQLSPASIGVLATVAGVRVEIFLNGRVSGGTFASVGGSSLAQYSLHPNTTTITGGESIYTFFAPAGGVSSQDLSKIRDIGNSILGGGSTLNVPTTPTNIYPDGPDILTICVTPLAINASIAARMAWTEAQA
jgi:hypothetical protein